MTDRVDRRARPAGVVALWVNAGWMAFVWVTRLRNIAGDDELAGSTRRAAVALAIAGLAGAVVLVVVALRRGPFGLARAVVAAHAGVWVVRGLQIAATDRGLAFVVVHEVLALVSVGLAVWLWVATGGFRAGRRASLPSAPLWDSP
jgi:hypothetical protein